MTLKPLQHPTCLHISTLPAILRLRCFWLQLPLCSLFGHCSSVDFSLPHRPWQPAVKGCVSHPIVLAGVFCQSSSQGTISCAWLWTGLCLPVPTSTGWMETHNPPGTRSGCWPHQSCLCRAVPDLSSFVFPEPRLCSSQW